MERLTEGAAPRMAPYPERSTMERLTEGAAPQAERLTALSVAPLPSPAPDRSGHPWPATAEDFFPAVMSRSSMWMISYSTFFSSPIFGARSNLIAAVSQFILSDLYFALKHPTPLTHRFILSWGLNPSKGVNGVKLQFPSYSLGYWTLNPSKGVNGVKLFIGTSGVGQCAALNPSKGVNGVKPPKAGRPPHTGAVSQSLKGSEWRETLAA